MREKGGRRQTAKTIRGKVEEGKKQKGRERGEKTRRLTFHQQLLRRRQQAPRKNDDTGRSISRFNILSRTQLDQHPRSRVQDRHVLEDGGTVVGDDDFSGTGLDHLVHALGTERGSDGVGDS